MRSRPGPGYDPGSRAASGVVACSEIDARLAVVTSRPPAASLTCSLPDPARSEVRWSDSRSAVPGERSSVLRSSSSTWPQSWSPQPLRRLSKQRFGCLGGAGNGCPGERRRRGGGTAVLGRLSGRPGSASYPSARPGLGPARRVRVTSGSRGNARAHGWSVLDLIAHQPGMAQYCSRC